jgi:hypothetical protein
MKVNIKYGDYKLDRKIGSGAYGKYTLFKLEYIWRRIKKTIKNTQLKS